MKIKKTALLLLSRFNVYQWIVILIGFSLAIFLAFYLISAITQTNGDVETINVYFRETDTYEWKEERYQIAKSEETEMVKEVLDHLKNGPKSSRLLKSIPDFIDVVYVQLTCISQPDGQEINVAEITFTDSYNSMTHPEALDCTTALVWTLTELDFIDSVHFYIGDEELMMQDGNPIGLLDRSNVRLEIDVLENTAIQEVTLYFSDEQVIGLVTEKRKIETNPDEDIEKFIVNALINGPEEDGSYQLIPPETKVISAKRDDVICTVDLSSAFIDKMEGGSSSEMLAIASIVNTLTERQGIMRVQILIEGEVLSQPTKHGVDLSKPFEQMPDYIF